MKKIIATISLFTFFACYPAYAFVPVAIPAWYWGASVALHVAGAVAGLYHAMKPSTPSKVSSSGHVNRPSSAVWVDLKDFKPSLNEKDISAVMSPSKLRQISDKVDSDSTKKYPLVNAALHKLDDNNKYNSKSGYSSSLPPSVGNTVTINGKTHLITGVGPMQGNCNGVPCSGKTPGLIYNGNQVQVLHLNKQGSNTYYQYYMASFNPSAGTTLPIVPVPDNEIFDVLSGQPSGDLNLAYQAELDKMFQDPDYVPFFSDDTTGLPFSVPSGVLTPSQLAAANASAAAQEAKETAAASAQNASSSAQTAASTAAAAYTASGGDPVTGTGGDSALLQKLRDAEAAAAASQAAADKLKADQAVDDALEAPGLPGDNIYDSSVTAPDKKNITELLTSFAAGSPLISMVQSFTISTSGASGVVPIGIIYGQELSFDFTRWESILRTCGGVLILIMHGYAVLIVVRGW